MEQRGAWYTTAANSVGDTPARFMLVVLVDYLLTPAGKLLIACGHTSSIAMWDIIDDLDSSHEIRLTTLFCPNLKPPEDGCQGFSGINRLHSLSILDPDLVFSRPSWLMMHLAEGRGRFVSAWLWWFSRQIDSGFRKCGHHHIALSL